MKKIERYSLVDEAYKRIKEEILTKGFSEGNKIPSENQLCKALSVSRVVVREALARLKSERIIVTYHGKGSYLANPKNFTEYGGETAQLDFSHFKQIIEFRECIEYSAIKLAVENASLAQLNLVRDCAKSLRDSVGDLKIFTEMDYQFHLQIAKCSQNDLIVGAIESNKDSIIQVLGAMNKLSGSVNYAVELHEKVAEKLVLRDAKGAIELLKNNGEYNLARMSEVFK